MQTAASLSTPPDVTWRVVRDGAVIATMDMRQDGGEIVVSTTAGSRPLRPNRFETPREADSFMADLLASFAYLGCEVARA